ncbi:TOM1-like protein 5 [Rutidosis leptorrhynchoides]|uniref:TOM1-like protein 5 n=1 Tax=Rutidosis leptorrhynchoides TaxID=125765 RepID=UPI003A9A4AAC
MAAELVNAATSERLTEMDWTKSIEICELVARDNRQARDVIKAIKKRLGSKSKDTQLFAVMLLEVLMNNIGEPIHTQVIDTGILPILVKIVKKKSTSDLPVREKIFLLLDATQTSLGGASGRFPQYYSAYYDLVSSGVKFSQRPEVLPRNRSNSDSSKSNSSVGEVATNGHDRSAPPPPPPTVPQPVPESSIVKKAGSALEVLRDVLDAIDVRHPEQAKDEFTLDLVEQCSFHKQRVMHLAVTSRDERTISQAVELNDQLQKALSRHDALVSGRSVPVYDAQIDQEDTEEEDPEQLFRRMRKGKARVRPEADNHQPERPLLVSSVPPDRLNRPLIRPISLGPKDEPATTRPTTIAAPAESAIATGVVIPPPPSKHVEREKFFQENKTDGTSIGCHMRGLSLHSRNASSSRRDSFDISD